MAKTRLIIGHLAATFCLACLTACDEQIATESADPADQTNPPAAQSAPAPNTGGGGSALGGARNAAGDTVSNLEERSDEIAEEIDDQ